MHRLSLCLSALLSLGTLTLAEPTDFAISQETWHHCHTGNVQNFSDYVGAPAILVCVYKCEPVRPEREAGLHKWFMVYHARVVGSNVNNIPFGKAVVFHTYHEGTPSYDTAKGQLLYIVDPHVRTEYRTGEIELSENFNRVPLEGNRQRYEMGKRGVEALKH